jgi:hypothetical protein
MSTESGKNRRAPAHKESSDDPRFLLTKAVQQMNQRQEAFLNGVEAFKSISNDLEMRFSSKRKQLEDLDEEYEQHQKTKKFELEQAIREEGYKHAIQILSERDEEPIAKTSLTKLKQDFELLQKQKSQEIAAAAESEKAKYIADKKQLEEMSRLKHEAENAKHVAELEQYKMHIKVLQEQIADLKKDADKQRDLTKSLAEASRPQMMTQMSNPQKYQ